MPDPIELRDQSEHTVIVPCEPTWQQLAAGAKALDAWSDDALRDEIDGSQMAARVYKAMTSEGSR